MKPAWIMGVSVLAIATAAFAQDVISTRQEAMEGQGKNMKALAAMAKGEVPFDAATAETALAGLAASAQTVPNLFPEDSKPDSESAKAAPEGTEASPAIWEKPDAFKEIANKFITDTSAGVAAAPKSADELATVLGPIAGDCKSCHENFRIEKD